MKRNIVIPINRFTRINCCLKHPHPRVPWLFDIDLTFSHAHPDSDEFIFRFNPKGDIKIVRDNIVSAIDKAIKTWETIDWDEDFP